MLKARPDRKNPPPSSDEMSAAMIGSRSVDRIRAAVKSTANAVHMSAPAEEHHPSKKTLQQGSHPHMPLCFAIPSGQHACVQWVEDGHLNIFKWDPVSLQLRTSGHKGRPVTLSNFGGPERHLGKG